MVGLELTILFKDGQGYIVQDKPLILEQVDFAKSVQSSKGNAFWTFRVLDYKQATGRIFCEVLSYQSGDTDFPEI